MKKIKLRIHGSPIEAQTKVAPETMKRGKKLLFNEETKSQPHIDVSQKKLVAATGGEDLPDRDLTDKEWCMQYVDSKKKVVLYTTKKKGEGQLGKETPFMYGRILRFDYEDADSANILVMIECSKGVRKVFLSEDLLVKESCGPEAFKKDLESSQNLIVTLRPYIQGHVTLRDEVPSPLKATKRVSKVQSRPPKKKTTKMSDTDSTSENEEEDNKGTSGAELASGVLSSE